MLQTRDGTVVWTLLSRERGFCSRLKPSVNVKWDIICGQK